MVASCKSPTAHNEPAQGAASSVNFENTEKRTAERPHADNSSVITEITVEQAARMERYRQVALDQAAAYRREQREGGGAAIGAADDKLADAAASADAETRGSDPKQGRIPRCRVQWHD